MSARAYRFASILYFSALEEWRRRWNLIGRVAFFSVIVFIWWRIWVVGAPKLTGEVAKALSAVHLTWYIAVTELVVLSIAMSHLAIENDVRSGDFSAHRSRPMSYLTMQLAKAWGSSLMQFLLLSYIGTVIVFFYLRTWPWSHLSLMEQAAFAVVTVVLAFMGLMIASTWYVILGLVGVWIEEVSPIVWIFQKLMFLFGGLVVPIALYPMTLQHLAAFSPFSAMMGEPASLVFAPDWGRVPVVFCKLVFWLMASLSIARFVYRKADAYADKTG